MSSVYCWSSGLGQSDHLEDGIQKDALKEMIMHIMHHELKPDFESLVRNIVREELRNLLNGLDRNFGDQVHTSEPRCLKLQFLNNVSLPVFTNEDIQGEGPSSIEVALVDNLNDKVVDYGPEASAKVELVALDGDGGGAMGDDWTAEDFNRNIIREREGAHSKGKKNKKREGKWPLLDGDVHLRLNKGLGVVGKVKFRQYTHWMKNHKFKLGARVLDSFSGVRIREAVTKPFIVRDRRAKCERKRGSPSLSDDVSKLKNITKNSKRHKGLQKKNINIVEDFLIQLFKDPGHLEQVPCLPLS